MNIKIQFYTDSLTELFSSYLKHIITFLYKWLTTEGEALGYILGHIHFILFIFLIICVIVSHTIYPRFWLQFVIFCAIFIIWLQHIILKVCISSVAEKELTKNLSPFHEFVEIVFGISANDFNNNLIVGETIGLICLGLELVGRVSIYLHKHITIPIQALGIV